MPMTTAGSKRVCEKGDRSPAPVGNAPPSVAPRKQSSPIPPHPTFRTEILTGSNFAAGQNMPKPLEEKLEHGGTAGQPKHKFKYWKSIPHKSVKRARLMMPRTSNAEKRIKYGVLKCSYDKQLRGLLHQYKVRKEEEIVTGHVWSMPKSNTKKQGDLKERLKQSYSYMRKEFRQKFESTVEELFA
ncbi:RNA-dependent RNA polymerase 6 [Linum perenne]